MDALFSRDVKLFFFSNVVALLGVYSRDILFMFFSRDATFPRACSMDMLLDRGWFAGFSKECASFFAVILSKGFSMVCVDGDDGWETLFSVIR